MRVKRWGKRSGWKYPMPNGHYAVLQARPDSCWRWKVTLIKQSNSAVVGVGYARTRAMGIVKAELAAEGKHPIGAPLNTRSKQ
jgi:hypothetical protein